MTAKPSEQADPNPSNGRKSSEYLGVMISAWYEGERQVHRQLRAFRVAYESALTVLVGRLRDANLTSMVALARHYDTDGLTGIQEEADRVFQEFQVVVNVGVLEDAAYCRIWRDLFNQRPQEPGPEGAETPQ